jgi:SAM-dependent methyltransferase
MSREDNRRAWADFWRAGRTKPSTCLPAALEQIDAAQSALWRGLARDLPKRAYVLDLGTGDGIVLRKLAQSRPDLRLTGIDSAPILPPPPKGIVLKPDVALESLPFPAGRFDALTSQFGYEYGDTAAAAAEVARVLKQGGRFLFALHRRDGPIVAHNLPRRDALRWALGESGQLDKARTLAAARRLSLLPTPPSFRAAPAEASRRFPGQSAAGEFLEAILQTLELGRHAPPDEVLDALAELESKAINEIARIDTLDRAACDSDRIDFIVEQLRAAGMAVDAPASLVERSGRAFAWVLTGLRLSGP